MRTAVCDQNNKKAILVVSVCLIVLIAFHWYYDNEYLNVCSSPPIFHGIIKGFVLLNFVSALSDVRMMYRYFFPLSRVFLSFQFHYPLQRDVCFILFCCLS